MQGTCDVRVFASWRRRPQREARCALSVEWFENFPLQIRHNAGSNVLPLQQVDRRLCGEGGTTALEE